MVSAGQVTASTLVFEQGGKQQWLPASQYSHLFKSPTVAGGLVPNPVATYLPIAPGCVESTVWQCSSSTWTLLDRIVGPFALAVGVIVLLAVAPPHLPRHASKIATEVGCGAILIVVLSFARPWVHLKATSWTLTTERLCLKKGVCSRTIHNIERSRFKEVSLRKPLLLRE